MAAKLVHEEKECSAALDTLLASYPYDNVSRYAINEGFSADQPNFYLVTAEEAGRDNLQFGTGGNCIVLPEILRERLAIRGLTGQLIADENREHVVLCIAGENGSFVICDPGLLCVKPFTVSPEIQTTAVHVVDNPGGKDKFGFSVELKPDAHRFAINKDKTKSGTRTTYEFDLSNLGNLEAVRETDIKNTLSVRIPLVSKLVMPAIGTVAALDSISVRDKRGKVKEFAHRTGINAEELWRRLDVGNQVRRTLQATQQSGITINWRY